MRLDLTTPALLFPAISLLLLAYTNRYLTLATLIRELHGKTRLQPRPSLQGQIHSLRRRVLIIRAMQLLGVSAFLFCVLSMFFMYLEQQTAGELIFGGSLVLLILSLGASLWELWLSVDALQMQLDDCDPIQLPVQGQTGCSDQ